LSEEIEFGVNRAVYEKIVKSQLKPFSIFGGIPQKPLTKRQKVARFWRNRKYNLGERLSKTANKLGFYDNDY
jgi:hypothetical protein